MKELKHYKTEYHNIEGLREHFSNQLDKLAATEFVTLQPEEQNEQPVKIYHINKIDQATFN